MKTLILLLLTFTVNAEPIYTPQPPREKYDDTLDVITTIQTFQILQNQEKMMKQMEQDRRNQGMREIQEQLIDSAPKYRY